MVDQAALYIQKAWVNYKTCLVARQEAIVLREIKIRMANEKEQLLAMEVTFNLQYLIIK